MMNIDVYEKFYQLETEDMEPDEYSEVTDFFTDDEIRYLNGVTSSVPDREHYENALRSFVEFEAESIDSDAMREALETCGFETSEIDELLGEGEER